MEERGLEIIRKKTEYLGCNEHQDAQLHLQLMRDREESADIHARIWDRHGGRIGRECLKC